MKRKFPYSETSSFLLFLPILKRLFIALMIPVRSATIAAAATRAITMLFHRGSGSIPRTFLTDVSISWTLCV